jgi:hypothetical protein
MINRKLDLIGKRFGKLTGMRLDENALELKIICKCDCGNEKSVKPRYLINDLTKSCGCFYDKDLSGQVFGELKVIKKIDNKKRFFWLVRCSCGIEKEVSQNSLISGNTKSCGCKKIRKCQLGDKFGKLTVISDLIIKEDKTHYYKVKCDCGKEKEVEKRCLTTGNTTSCGCGRKGSREDKIKIVKPKKEKIELESLEGKIFTKLNVLNKINNEENYLCKCECGNTIILSRHSLISKRRKSCGCLRPTGDSIVGKQFNQLLVLSIEKSGNPLCKCDCGVIKEIDRSYLRRGAKSCGHIGKSKKLKEFQIGEKFNRWTIIEIINDPIDGKFYRFKCECGEETIEKIYRILNESSKSCGCYQRDNRRIDGKLFPYQKPLNDHESFIRSRWLIYVRIDQEKNLYDEQKMIPFTEFLKLSKENCTYCGTEPQSNTEDSENIFIFNGLDRVDNSLGHYHDNVVPCCFTCNRAKLDRNVDEFINWIKLLKCKDFSPIDIKKISFKPRKSILEGIISRRYSDTNLEFEEFHYLTQQPCFYCGRIGMNCRNINKKEKFNYNGLDRIDSSRGHDRDNVVSCCKDCNYAKSNSSLKEFNSWIERIQNFQKQKSTTLMVL